MIDDEPRGENLLATARDLLRGPLRKALPKEHQLDALMIANAMAIASRELEAARQSPAGGSDALAELAAALGVSTEDSNKISLRVRVAQAIRSGGGFDDSVQEVLLSALLIDAKRRVAIGNPRYIESETT